MTPVLLRLPPLLLIGLSLIVPAACGGSEREQSTTEPSPPVSVRVAPAQVLERAEPIEAGGVVAATETAVVSSRVVATVTTVAVRAGDRVRTGDVVVRLDARDLTARAREAGAAATAAEEALAAARSARAAAAAEHKLAAAWLARITQLRDRNSATAQEFDEADARLAGAAARATAAEATVAEATARVASVRAGAEVATVAESYAVIRAPFDGEVTERFTDPGNLATPGQPLLHIDAIGRRRVDVRVDEARAAYVRPGDRVAVLLDDTRAASADTAIEGVVLEVARAVAADQRAFTVKVALPQNTAPRTGTFARVRFDGARRRALIVPASAVRWQGQLTSVFVVSNGVAHLRLVQTGGSIREGTEIVAGLDAGERVVAAPPPHLRDGQAVQIDGPTSTGASP